MVMSRTIKKLNSRRYKRTGRNPRNRRSRRVGGWGVDLKNLQQQAQEKAKQLRQQAQGSAVFQALSAGFEEAKNKFKSLKNEEAIKIIEDKLKSNPEFRQLLSDLLKAPINPLTGQIFSP